MRQPSKVIPQVYIDKLEVARKELYALLPDADTTLLCHLTKITDPMWQITHRKWEDANDPDLLLQADKACIMTRISNCRNSGELAAELRELARIAERTDIPSTEPEAV